MNSTHNRILLVAIITFSIMIALPLIAIVLFAFINSILYQPQGAEEILSDSIVDYRYFLIDRKIDDYSVYDPVLIIRTSIDLEKIPEVLSKNILSSCTEDNVTCSSPVWSESNEDDYDPHSQTIPDDTWKYWHRTFQPGEQCATAENLVSLKREVVCVNIYSGVFTYVRY